jgi:subtilisin family serine protease
MPRRGSRRLAAAAAAGLALLVGSGVGPAHARAANDPALNRQWGLAKIGAAKAWDTATGAGTVIAVVDSGVDLNHEDLVGKILPGKDYTGVGSVQDDCGHGTHVSGIAAAVTNNGKGVAGVAPDAKILPVKVLAPNGNRCAGSTTDIQDGIKWAADQGATVINLSLGSDIQFLTGSGLGDSLSYAWSKGAIPVVAAGNSSLFGSGYSNESAIIVTASGTQDDSPSYSSTTGSAKWAMSAPGGDGSGDDGDILSTYFIPGQANQYGLLAGTSMATPHVAGAAAVLRSMGLTPQQTVDRLLGTAADLGAKGKDNLFGSGRLDLAKAVAAGGGTAPPTTRAAPAPTTVARAGGAGPTTTQRRTSSAGSGGGSTRATAGGAAPTTAGSAAPVPDTSAPPVSIVPADSALPPPKVVLDVDDASGSSKDRPTGLLAVAGLGLGAAVAATILTLRSRRARGQG